MKFFKTFLASLLAVVVGIGLVALMWTMILIGIMASFTSSFTSSPETVPPNSVLRLNLHTITDSPAESPFENLEIFSLGRSSRTTLLSAVSAVRAAATDDRIKGIYINFDEYAKVSLSSLEEIRAALVQFRESGKFIVAYNENYSQAAYYLASVADRIYMNPEGDFDWRGLSLRTMFYKGLLDKLDVEPVIIRHGTFKAAVEPYIYDRMSPENRLQNQTFANSVWNVVVGAVSESRKIPTDDLQSFANELAIYSPAAALEKGFVDGLKYEDEVMEELNSLVNARREEANTLTDADTGIAEETDDKTYDESGEVWASRETMEQEADFAGEVVVDEDADTEVAAGKARVARKSSPHIVSFGGYASQVSPSGKSLSKNKIAVIYAEGSIMPGESVAGATIGSVSMSAKLARVRKDPNVKALVFRVNSPGGSALASEVILRELKLLHAEIPVIVSMGDYAASGGYYIACPADVIYANNSTITGSIGVFARFFNAGNALKNKLGVTTDVVRTNEYSDIGSPFRAPAPAELRYFQKSVENVYRTFVGHVAAGRNMTVEAVDKIGEGRIWSGLDAVGIGLVDGIGGIHDAIAIAADRAGVADDYRIWEVVDAPTGLASLFGSALASIRGRAESDAMGEMFVHYRQLKETLKEEGVQARIPYLLEFE